MSLSDKWRNDYQQERKKKGKKSETELIIFV